jgi:hypothetical protein
MGDRDPRVGGRRDTRRHPRHDLEAHAGLGQRFGLLAAAAEHERVAALQPDHALPGLPQLHQLRVDLVLLDRRLARLLAHVAELRAGAGAVERPGRDQPVVEHDVGARDQLQRAPGHQPWITGTGADEIHDAALHARKR